MPMKRKLYPPNWEELSWSIRYERALGRCERCGAVNHEPHPVTGSKIVLTVAHLDHNTANNDPENLAALCQRCHFDHDRPANLAAIRQRRLEQEALDREAVGQLPLFDVAKRSNGE